MLIACRSGDGEPLVARSVTSQVQEDGALTAVHLHGAAARAVFGGAAAARCRLFFISYTLIIYQGGILMVVLLPYLFTVQNTTHAGQSAVRFRVYQSQLLAHASYKQNTK